jgi:hypothetical protein
MMENATATLSENSSKEQTIRFDLVEQLARKMCISLEDARNALEAADWNMLTATHMLEQEAFCRKQALNDAAEHCAVNDNAAQASATAGKAAAFGKDTRDSAAAKKKATAKQKKWFSNLCDHLRRLLTYGNRNRFTIFKDGEQLLEMPVTALALLLLFSFGTCALLMLVGLFAGCRYNITNAVEA